METLNRYRERYPTAEQMGRLQLSDLEDHAAGRFRSAWCSGNGTSSAKANLCAGNFSLVFRKFDDRWLIVHDHTSQLID